VNQSNFRAALKKALRGKLSRIAQTAAAEDRRLPRPCSVRRSTRSRMVAVVAFPYFRMRVLSEVMLYEWRLSPPSL
jgi:hypothetical protein